MTSTVVNNSWASRLIAAAALTLDETKLSAQDQENSTVDIGFRDWTPQIDFSNIALKDVLPYRR